MKTFRSKPAAEVPGRPSGKVHQNASAQPSGSFQCPYGTGRCAPRSARQHRLPQCNVVDSRVRDVHNDCCRRRDFPAKVLCRLSSPSCPPQRWRGRVASDGNHFRPPACAGRKNVVQSPCTANCGTLPAPGQIEDDSRRRGPAQAAPLQLESVTLRKCLGAARSCPREDSNLHGIYSHMALNHARLPVPPLGLGE